MNISINFKLDHEKLGFVGYEFEVEDGVYLDEIESEQYLFRVDFVKHTDEVYVYSAYSQDYDIMEEVTYYFDTDELKKAIEEIEKKREIPNHGVYFREYVRLRDEGWDCEAATMK